MTLTMLPILRGIVGSEDADYKSSIPINWEPVIQETGVNKGYLRAPPGVTLTVDTGLGADRGGIEWLGVHYRVIGSKLVTITNGGFSILGDVGNNDLPVSLDFSFTLLAIASNERLFYLDAGVINQVTDTNLGVVIDVMYLDGRFITTDGTSIVLTMINNPYAVDPLAYGSAEVSPDPIVGLNHIRGEMNAIGSGTIENFQDIGGANTFPYQRQPGALIAKGCVGTHAFAYIGGLETYFFVGGAPNSGPSVWVAGGGQATNISTQEIDDMLQGLSDAELALVEVESREDSNEQRLLVHLPDRTLVYLVQTSKSHGDSVWYEMRSGTGNDQPYPLRHLTLIDGTWYGGTADGKVGVLDTSVETIFGQERGWRFDTMLIYNQSNGAIINSLELIGLTGRAPFGAIPQVFMSYTKDGETWSTERSVESGRFGQRAKRVQLRLGWSFRNYMGLRFRGAGNGRQAWNALQLDIEGLMA